MQNKHVWQMKILFMSEKNVNFVTLLMADPIQGHKHYRQRTSTFLKEGINTIVRGHQH